MVQWRNNGETKSCFSPNASFLKLLFEDMEENFTLSAIFFKGSFHLHSNQDCFIILRKDKEEILGGKNCLGQSREFIWG